MAQVIGFELTDKQIRAMQGWVAGEIFLTTHRFSSLVEPAELIEYINSHYYGGIDNFLMDI